MRKIPWNENWLFWKEGREESRKTVSLPHDAMIYEDRDKKLGTGNGCAFFAGGQYYYTKTLHAPEEYRDRFVALEFEGVYKNAQVLVNGKLAGFRPYGYSNFYVELGPYLKHGEENEICVIADNSQMPNSRWYSGSGIYREVQLYVAGRTHIAFDGVRIRTLSTDPAKIRVDVAVERGNTDGAAGCIEVKCRISYQGSVVAEGTGETQEIVVPDARMWDDEHPNLYECRTEVYEDGKLADVQTESFGIRQIVWSPRGLFINGRETLLRGACFHHDNGSLGACAFRTAEERKVRLMKEAGFNAIRSSHNPVSRALLDACDKYGMYLIDETFDQWFMHKNPYDYTTDFEEWWEADTLSMVRKDFNHPSVIMYSIGNEISETAQPRGPVVAKAMRDAIRNLDQTRPVTTAVSLLLNAMVSMGLGLYKEDQSPSDGLDSLSGSAFVNLAMAMFGGFTKFMAKSPMADRASKAVFREVDICGYNYGGGRYDRDARKYPERVIVGSETLPTEIYDNWQKVKKLPSVVGDFIWTGWDYIGESGIACTQYDSWNRQEKNPPMLLGGAGVIDITGMARPEVWLYRAVYGLDRTPYIGVEPVIYSRDHATSSPWRKTDAVHSWSWEGCEGEKASVVVYSNADEVALYKNGQLVGKKKVKKCCAHFTTTYEPGSLEAAAFSGGRKVGKSVLKTAGKETILTVVPETVKLRADGQELAYINISITDGEGIVKSTEKRNIRVSVEGAGTLQGFGTADPHTDETFVGNERSSYYGRAQAVVRAGLEAGEIRVHVFADGLKEQCIRIEVTDVQERII